MRKCHGCQRDITLAARFALSDVMYCQQCRQLTPTGKEDELRRMMEGNWTDSYPKITGGRAVYYSNNIYELANKGTAIDFAKVEKKLWKTSGARKTNIVGMNAIAGRKYRGHTDAGVGCLIIGLSDDIGNRYVYVVFRGSVGAKKAKSNTGAGRSLDDPSVNMDWRINFDNRMTEASWEPQVKVHGGFLDVYESYCDEVRMHLFNMLGRLPGAQVIITGHSQGAAHAILCAHHMSHDGPPGLAPVCLPFSAPRVGNFEFASDFNKRISMQNVWYPADQGSFLRCIVAVQKDDKVPKGQSHSFAAARTKGDQKIADGSQIIPKAIWASMLKKESETEIFYHVKTFYKAATFGMHHPGALQFSMLRK
jgi:hypothetical protein